MRAVWRRVEPLVPTRRGAVGLFVLALVVYRLEAFAWPFERGRDTWDYMTYYLSLFDAHTPFPEVMLVRTPVTPLALGIPLSLGGVTALEVTMAVLYALSVLAWSLAALAYSRLSALLVAVVLLASSGFALSFHEASSDAIASFAFALFALGVVRTGFLPSAARFAALGAGAAVVTLTRPAYVGLIAGALIPLCLRGSWRSRLAWGGAYAGVFLVLLGSWATLNDVRYGDFTISRLNITSTPIRLVPDAGPASRTLATIVQRDVLSLPPYRRLNVSLATYFGGELSGYERLRVLGIADRADGIGSDFRLLRETNAEASASSLVGAHAVAAGPVTASPVSASPGSSKLVWVAHAMWRYLSRPANRDQTHLKPVVWPTPPPTTVRAGKPFPNEAALPASLEAATFGFFPCASNEVARCILTEPSKAYSDPRLSRRYAEVTRTVSRWDAPLGTGHPNRWLAAQLDRVARHFPPPWLWLVVAAVALPLRRARGVGTLLAVVGLAGMVLFTHAWVAGWFEAYAYPVLPAAFFAAICAGFGKRGG